MDINTFEEPNNIKVVPGHLFVRRVKSAIRRYERRYEMTAEQMWAKVESGAMPETLEISHWMQNVLTLKLINGELPPLEGDDEPTGQTQLEHAGKLRSCVPRTRRKAPVR